MSLPRLVRPAQILLVEDSPTDTLLAVEAFESSKLHTHLHTVTDGDAALDFLHARGVHAGAARPDLVLLDLNLPRKDGREVLREMKADPELRGIPVVVLTTSSQETDVLRAYGLQAAAYIVKPIDFAQFAAVVRDVEHFWFVVATLPGRA